MEEAIKEFFHQLNVERKNGTRNVLDDIIDRFVDKFMLERSFAVQCLVELVNNDLIHHFDQPKFNGLNHDGRTAWLYNLMVLDKSGMGKRKMREAIDRVNGVVPIAKEEKQLSPSPQPEDIRRKQRDNHPISQYEWTDEATGLRFYDDATDGQLMIPPNAPPRPTDSCTWNVIRLGWFQNGMPIGKDGQLEAPF